MQTLETEEFNRAVQFERELQVARAQTDTAKSVPYLHRSGKPLDQIDFRSDFEKGQMSLWDDECEGMCGV